MKQSLIQAIHPVLMVRDVSRAIEFYGRLGFTLGFSDDPREPRYAGLRRDRVELHVQSHEETQWVEGLDRPSYRLVVTDVALLHAELREQVPARDITDVLETAWGTREFHLRDPDGNVLQFYVDTHVGTGQGNSREEP
ncbi:MAG: VOC family protein [Planctomycetales bacterium]|nr:VOC family protein [Planctomycetales bacterium]